jgi:hypothetical protein
MLLSARYPATIAAENCPSMENIAIDIANSNGETQGSQVAIHINNNAAINSSILVHSPRK